MPTVPESTLNPPSLLTRLLAGHRTPVPLQRRGSAYLDRWLLRQSGPASIDTTLGPIGVPELADIQARYLRLFGVWEPVVSAAVWALLPPGASFVDIGAHFGYYSLLAARRGTPSDQLLAAEPVERVREVLQSNLQSAGLAKAQVRSVAVGRTSGTIRIHEGPRGNLGGSRTVTPTDEKDGTDVPMITMAELADWNVLRPGWLKVDVEGDELAVLQSVADAALNTQFPFASVEITASTMQQHGQDPADLLSLIKHLGYAAFVTPNAYSRAFYHQCLQQSAFDLERMERWPAALERADVVLVQNTRLQRIRVSNPFGLDTRQ